MKHLIRMIALSLLALSFSACGASQETSSPDDQSMRESSLAAEATAERDEIDASVAQQMVEDGATLVDVRVHEEFAAEHIPGAANVPLETISRAALDEQGIRGAVILYCNSGNQSSQALEKLRNEGYNSVFSIGSIDDWPGETTTTGDSSSVLSDTLAQMDDDNSPIDDDVDPFEGDDESPVGIDDDNNSLDNNGDGDSINVDDDDNDSLGGADDI